MGRVSQWRAWSLLCRGLPGIQKPTIEMGSRISVKHNPELLPISSRTRATHMPGCGSASSEGRDMYTPWHDGGPNDLWRAQWDQSGESICTEDR